MHKAFRIFYSTTYTALFVLLLLLLAITPGDLIRQFIGGSNIQNAFIIAGVYFLTALLALFTYASRLYTNKTVLAGIPKYYVPVQPGEIGKSIRQIIVKNLDRTSSIAFQTRPRDVRSELSKLSDDAATPERPLSAAKPGCHDRNTTMIPPATLQKAWGDVVHPGWSSPSSEDLSNLQFSKVVRELPHLIEAKAVSLAPPEPVVDTQGPISELVPQVPDARIVAMLQRPAPMGLRDYLAHLSSLGLIGPPSLCADFLRQYDYARFSTLEITEPQFRSLMDSFGAILSSMTHLESEVLDQLSYGDLGGNDGDSAFSDVTSGSDFLGRQYGTPSGKDQTEPYDDGSPVGTVRTAPSRVIRSTSGARTVPRPLETSSTSSQESVRRRIYPVNSYPSSSSLRSAQSVIRLHPAPGPDDLPYEFVISGN